MSKDNTSMIEYLDDQPLNPKINGQNNEVPIGELSGDEAIEQSFTANSFHTKSFGQKKSKSSIFLSSTTVTKSILGVGILGLPNVAYNFGLIPSILLILFFYIQTQYNTLVLLKCKNLCRHSNYSTIGYSVFKGKWILVVINLIIIINNFGLCFAEMIIQGTAAKNLMSQITDSDSWYTSRAFLSSMSGLVMVPMMIVQKIEKLKIVSLTAVIAMATFCITLTYSFFTTISETGFATGFSLFPYEFDFLKAFGCFPTLLLAYNWQFNLFPVYKGMQKPSDRNMMIVCSLGMSFATVFYLLVGMMGFAIFGKDIQTNFLMVVTPENIGRVGFIILNLTFYISTVLTTPLVFFGARNNFLQLLKQTQKKEPLKMTFDSSQESPEQTGIQLNLLKRKNKRDEQRLFYFWSIFLFVIIVIGAITITQLEVAFNIVGSVSSNSIGCLLPSLFYYKLMDQYALGAKLTGKEKFEYYFAKVFCVYSVVMSLLCLTSEFINVIRE